MTATLCGTLGHHVSAMDRDTFRFLLPESNKNSPFLGQQKFSGTRTTMFADQFAALAANP
jgi:hypothetical protein